MNGISIIRFHTKKAKKKPSTLVLGLEINSYCDKRYLSILFNNNWATK